MKIILTVLLTALASNLSAQTSVDGVWEGELAVNDNTKISVQFTVATSADGVRTAILNAPDQPALTDIAASNVEFTDGKLSIQVPTVSGAYEGFLADGRFDGSWTQQGTSFPLSLTPYVAPILDEDDQRRLAGSWVGSLKPIPNSDLEIAVVMRFEADESGEFKAYFDSPDQGANGILMQEVSLDGDEFSASIARISARFTGSMGEDYIDGSIAQQGQQMSLRLERGEYQSKGLELSAEASSALSGRWEGELVTPAGTLALVMRFETAADGSMEAFMDSPDQGAEGIPITEVAFEDDSVVVTIAAVNGSYSATVEQNQLIGSWSQGVASLPLTLSRRTQ